MTVPRFALMLFVALTPFTVPAADPPKVKAKPNKLATESSPYLLQHAHNPVDWHPWGPEAFEKAKKEGKLVFLSIGYSSCHWCHVMERESFASDDIAKVLNEHFVCIKVDREERPDIDDVYMAALEVTGVRGGWPLTMFLTPDGKPIFGGTYFPPDDQKVGDDTRPGMKSMLKKVIALHRDKKDKLYQQADQIAKRTEEVLNAAGRGVALVKLDAQLVKDAVNEFDLDPEHGGLGRKATGYRGTKFPRVSALLFLLRQSAKPGNEALAKQMALTLDKMAQGGIYDHLGGGFHRYSTERTWTVPHFEKMLYDQAQLVELYCEAYRQTPNPAYRRVIDETLAFVARELTAPDGYFYSALDADSDGEEGRFYVWTPKELDAALAGEPEAALFRTVYGTDRPNFEDKYHILRLAKFPTDDELKRLAPLKQKLFDLRAKRNRPFLDTKLITAWNGQMIAAYALAGQVLKEPKYVAAAERAADFLQKTMTQKDGRLFRTYAAKPGDKPTAKGTAFHDDHAFLIHGLLALDAAGGDPKWRRWASGLMTPLRQKFLADGGGYFNTPADGEKLFARGRDSYDGAQPSANGMSVRNELRLWQITGGEGYRSEFERDLRRFAAQIKAEPTAVPQAVDALDAALTLGGLKDLPTRMAEKAKNPKDSSDVVQVTLSPLSLADGLESYAVGITVAKGWHIYANPVNNKDLAASATTVEFEIDGKPAKYQDLKYPTGTKYKDSSGAEYDVYEGQIGWTVVLAHDETKKAKAVTVKVKLIACDDKNCLKPSTIKVEAK
jgi:uncharacterized protein YyaL (SSP411 family)